MIGGRHIERKTDEEYREEDFGVELQRLLGGVNQNGKNKKEDASRNGFRV